MRKTEFKTFQIKQGMRINDKLIALITYGEFLLEIVGRFPELRDDILDEDYENNITLQIGVLTMSTQEAIDDYNTSFIEKSFSFVSEMIGKVEHKIENSLYLSFLNKLNFAKNPQAKRLLTKDLKSALDPMGEYDKSLERDEKLKSFLKSIQ